MAGIEVFLQVIPQKFTYPFRYVPHPLVEEAAGKLIGAIDSDPLLKYVFAEGKMLGVLVCEDPENGALTTLNAFSGLVGGRSVLPGFVPPIFDTTTVPALRNIEGPVPLETCATLGAVDGGSAPVPSPAAPGLPIPLRSIPASAVALRSECSEGTSISRDSKELQEWLFRQYRVMNGMGEEMDVKEIFALRGLVPPGGTGECAAPKLLNYAFRNGLKPLCMGEFWYGASPSSGEVRQHGRFYPSCTGKCGPLLSWMLRGIEVEDNPLQRVTGFDTIKVLYEDDTLLAVNKPSGMLCAPGLTGTESLQEILEKDYGKLYSCHRLDMDTSGVILFARTPQAQTEIHRQFSGREVKKTYLAHLCAGTRPWKGKMKGTIALPLAPDWDDRPRQMVDKQNGKPAITEFEILQIFPDGEMDVRFIPHTGRTHQLRVHAASPLGLGRPIKGDALYGDSSKNRLRLHAESLSFKHPVSGKIIQIIAAS
ncbi:MAG: RluA family pseudouridine synthase [Candidatus Cryptobacteroides sp.]